MRMNCIARTRGKLREKSYGVTTTTKTKLINGGCSSHGTSRHVTVMSNCFPETNFLVEGWVEYVDV